ncbi:MAG: hypothetical protein R2684_04980 [Pyrinomonadaceae bacterium]
MNRSFFNACIFAVAAAILLSAFIPAHAAEIPRADAVRIREAQKVRAKVLPRIWPVPRDTAFPMLFVLENEEFLIDHPAGSEDFGTRGFDPFLKSEYFSRPRVFNPAFLATFPAVAGSSLPTVVIGKAENTWVKTTTPWIYTVIHENFHQFADSRPGNYEEIAKLELDGGDETGMWMLNYPFPYEDADVNKRFSVLSNALADALEADKENFAANAAKYLKLRKDFGDSLADKDHRYLRFQLWKEGTARYTEIEAARLASKKAKPSKDVRGLPDFKDYAQFHREFKKQTIASLRTMKLEELKREVVYAFGASEAMLLDLLRPDWKKEYFKCGMALDTLFPEKSSE